ncbi:helix-turn-helix transcriptional regulator [Piscinibacter sp.]|uniref:helix-turn-helix transcriptional regulator n=1 Tax=Piscinibacter sp. TaxID=1903157 RepID=UPI0039E4B0AB
MLLTCRPLTQRKNSLFSSKSNQQMTPTPDPERPAFEARVAATEAVLRARCDDEESFITADGRVGESVAAELLGIAEGTLANKRRAGKAPPHFQVGGRGHPITYRLHDLAEWLEAFRNFGHDSQ